MTMFFGAAATEADAVQLRSTRSTRSSTRSVSRARRTVPTLGTPNTFMFGVTDGAVASGPVIAQGLARAHSRRRRRQRKRRPLPPAHCRTPRPRTRWSRRRRPRRTARSPSRRRSRPALSAAAAATDGQINLDLVANVNGCDVPPGDRPRVRRRRVGRRARERADPARAHAGERRRESPADPELRRRCDVGLPGVRLLRDLPVPRSRRRARGRRSASCTRLPTPSSRRSRTAGRRTRTSRRRSRSTDSSGSSKGSVRVGERDRIERLGHRSPSRRRLDMWAREIQTRVRLHEVPNRALVLVARP